MNNPNKYFKYYIDNACPSRSSFQGPYSTNRNEEKTKIIQDKIISQSSNGFFEDYVTATSFVCDKHPLTGFG